MSLITLGVIADTHIPDRKSKLHPAVLSIFQEAKVERILHAGDISLPIVLRLLEDIAPVIAVRGNRDWFGFRNLPLKRVLDFKGKRIGLTHGHGGLALYLQDKLRYYLHGPQTFDFYRKRAVRQMPQDVDAVVFGHNHAPMHIKEDGKLIFNPGSACCQVIPEMLPSVGLLHLKKDEIAGEIIYME